MTWVEYVSALGPTAVALVAALVVVIGWFVNSSKALNNEIKKEARQYKIEMCLSIMDFHERFSELTHTQGKVVVDDDRLFELFDEMKSKVLLYGDGEENVLIKDLVGNFRIAAENAGKKNEDEAVAHYNISDMTGRLLSLSQRKFRKELLLEDPVKISKALEQEAKK